MRKAKLCIYYLHMSVFLKGVAYLTALAVPCLWNAFFTRVLLLRTLVLTNIED